MCGHGVHTMLHEEGNRRNPEDMFVVFDKPVQIAILHAQLQIGFEWNPNLILKTIETNMNTKQIVQQA